MTAFARTGRDVSAKSPPAMIGVDALADELGVSTRHIRRLVDAGKCPPPVRLGACIRWPRVVIDTWIAGGCPNCRKRIGGAR